jgi:hypothetical protein
MAEWILNFTRRGTKDKKLMPQQARGLLEIGLWGIPETAQAKDKLAASDRVLVYVGAPDRLFLGDARISSPWHHWTDTELGSEKERYPTAGSFGAGIALADCRIWEKPVPLQIAWPQTQGAKTNPKARWYGAVARITSEDFDAILTAGLGTPQAAAEPSPAIAKPQQSVGAVADAHAQADTSSAEHGLADSGRLFAVARRIQQYLGAPKPMSEDGTRAFFIDKWLEALGYSDFDDIDHGSPVASGDFPDYVIRSGGHPVMAVEAKRIGHDLGPKEAAQIVKYGSVLGLRWGLLTDGRYLQVYDIPVTGLAPEDRLVLSIDLADFADREDFDTRTWPAAGLLAKPAMQTGKALERHAARELIRTRLTDPSSSTITALKTDLEQRKVILSRNEIVALVDDLIG